MVFEKCNITLDQFQSVPTMDLNNIPIQIARVILGQVTYFEQAPEKKVEPGEIVVGSIDDPITRSLYTVMKELECYVKKYVEADDGKCDPATDEKRAVHLSLATCLLTAVGNLFWHRIHQQFDQTNCVNLTTSVRVDWQVVVWKASEPSSMQTHIIDCGIVDLDKVLSALKKG